MECSVAIQVLPMDCASDEEICQVVDKVIEYIGQTGLDYFVGPFETAIQGTYDRCMEVLKNCQIVAASAGCKEMLCYAKIDYRPQGHIMTTEDKISKYHTQDSLCVDTSFEVA